MSESPAVPPPSDVVWNVDDIPAGVPLPRRVMRARREAAEPLAVAAADWAPSWTVAPAPDAPTDVSPYDELF
jgi:hypothetical protein